MIIIGKSCFTICTTSDNSIPENSGIVRSEISKSYFLEFSLKTSITSLLLLYKSTLYPIFSSICFNIFPIILSSSTTKIVSLPDLTLLGLLSIVPDSVSRIGKYILKIVPNPCSLLTIISPLWF